MTGTHRDTACTPLRLAGYAALFGIRDGGGDTIRKGAFARTLRERATGRLGPLPLFWQHRPGCRIGWVEHAGEDARGLQVIARIDQPASRAAAALHRRTICGLSFGYRVCRHWPVPRGRLLEDLELFEISLVTHPMQHGARVHLVR
ncbi:peptidase U35 [Croceicoccus estronivorus]|uniref:HK97 family phage prohead protease n=1 Tax=Croceicoccus estronivorus TaxID=1172626 RepID=UPI00082EBD80|nr:HK97 family phage prohead protease [Croceicoccus estronivorus]OCC24451.1 peptidase U35 [Croceicoccus estronivorus]